MSPPAVKIQVSTIAASLAEMAPHRAEQFQANAAAYTAKLDGLHEELKAIFAGLHSPNLLVFHPAWGYFADTYGLRQIAIEQAGKEPSPEQMQRIIDIAKASDIRVIFIQQQFSRGIALSVAEQIGGVVVSIDPLAEDYLANLKTVGRIIFEHLSR
jgi:zinc transport system substrate-binding protein